MDDVGGGFCPALESEAGAAADDNGDDNDSDDDGDDGNGNELGIFFKRTNHQV